MFTVCPHRVPLSPFSVVLQFKSPNATLSKFSLVLVEAAALYLDSPFYASQSIVAGSKEGD